MSQGKRKKRVYLPFSVDMAIDEVRKWRGDAEEFEEAIAELRQTIDDAIREAVTEEAHRGDCE